MNDLFAPLARRRRRDHEKGFTLIELLVVIAVLAVLASVVILNVTAVPSKGALTACQTDLKSVQTAVTAYYEDNGETYPTTGGAVPGVVIMADIAPTFLHTAPTSTGTVSLDSNGTATAANC